MWAHLPVPEMIIQGDVESTAFSENVAIYLHDTKHPNYKNVRDMN